MIECHEYEIMMRIRINDSFAVVKVNNETYQFDKVNEIIIKLNEICTVGNIHFFSRRVKVNL